jgi:proliferating cell nuclear antigen
MVKAKMSDPKIWKTAIGSITTLIEEAAFKFTPKSVSMRAMDPSHISMVDFELPAEAFDEYDVRDEVIVGVNLVDLDKILGRMRNDDSLLLEIPDDKSRLLVTFKGTSTRKLGIPLIDVEEEKIPEPKIQFTAEVKLPAGVLKDGLKDAEMVSDSVQMIAEKGLFIMKAEGDKGVSEMRLEEGDRGLSKIDVQRPASAKFGLEYLLKMLKEASSDDEITLRLGTDLPLLMEIHIGKGGIRFFLAPRIEV